MLVCRVGDIASRENSIDRCAGGGGLDRDVSLWIEVNLASEQGCVGVMAYGEEEPVDVDVEMTFVWLPLVFHDMGTLQDLFSKKAGGIAIKQNLYVFALYQTVLNQQ